MADIYTYTDLLVTFVIDPDYCTGTLYAAFTPSSGTPVEVTTTDYNAVTGEVNVSLTQAQTAGLHGIVGIQLNGFKDVGANRCHLSLAFRKNCCHKASAKSRPCSGKFPFIIDFY